MAKDRFSNQKRSNYDMNFRWGNNEYTSAVKCKIVMTPTNKKYIKDILNNCKIVLTAWEKDFLVSLESRAMMSEKQKLHFDKICDKLKNKLHKKII